MIFDEYWPYFLTGILLCIGSRIIQIFGSGKLKKRQDDRENKDDIKTPDQSESFILLISLIIHTNLIKRVHLSK